MVTVIKKLTGGTHPFYEYACLSTDVKPVSLVPENSLCREIDTGKKFYFSDGAWHEAPNRGGGSGGGGGAEKFIVTLTEENDTWTADKTVAEIVAADEANKVVVAKYPDAGMYVELPLNVAVEYQGVYATMFIGFVNSGNDNKIVSVQCTNQGSGDVIATTEQHIPTSSNAPLIVTLSTDETTGLLVGDHVCSAVYQAFAYEHRPVIMKLVIEGQDFGSFNLASAGLNYDNGSIVSYNFSGFSNGSVIRFSGAPSSSIRQITD